MARRLVLLVVPQNRQAPLPPPNGLDEGVYRLTNALHIVWCDDHNKKIHKALDFQNPTETVDIFYDW